MPDHIAGWIVGTGAIGQEYAKILDHLSVSYVAIGRSEASVSSFQAAVGKPAIAGGIENFIKTANQIKPEFAIVAVTANQLAAVAMQLVDLGIQKILLEKPGAYNLSDLEKIQAAAIAKKCKIYIAYNRHFLASVLKAQDLIIEDGGVRSFHFEFTEWPSRILSYEHPPGALENWFYLNSTHVVDLAFYLGGWPKSWKSFQSGELDWHKPAVFAGAGLSDSNAMFSYKADWNSAGRWSVEIMTAKRKLILCPLEQLKEQKVNEISISDVGLDDSLDKMFKPGFLRQTKAFLANDDTRLVTLADQIDHWSVFDEMAGK